MPDSKSPEGKPGEPKSTEIEGPRGPHQRFKWFVVSEALLDAPAFAAKYTAEAGAGHIAELWDAANTEFPPAEWIAPVGLMFEAHGESTTPVMFVTLPAPERRNEAWSIAMLPTAAIVLELRVFTLERAVLPKTADELVFVVETTKTARRNFGPPNSELPHDRSRGAFVTAILEICDGERQPLHTTAIELVDPRPILARRHADHGN